MWKRALKPLPMKPMLRRVSLIGVTPEFGRRASFLDWHSRLHEVVAHAKLVERGLWATVPVGIEDVAEVPEVLPSHGAGEEAGADLVAEGREERGAGSHLRPHLGHRYGNVVQDRMTLRLARFVIGDPEPAPALGVDPPETAVHGDAHVIRRLRHGHVEVDVLEHTGFRSASRALVARNDVIGEHTGRSPFARSEEPVL